MPTPWPSSFAFSSSVVPLFLKIFMLRLTDSKHSGKCRDALSQQLKIIHVNTFSYIITDFKIRCKYKGLLWSVLEHFNDCVLYCELKVCVSVKPNVYFSGFCLCDCTCTRLSSLVGHIHYMVSVSVCMCGRLSVSV